MANPLDRRRISVEIRCRCGHMRRESFSRAILKAGRKKYGPGFIRRQFGFYANNDCKECFTSERYHSQGIADHLGGLVAKWATSR